MKNLNVNEAITGYGIFTSSGSSFYIPDALHIEKIDDLMMFDSDDEAAIQAEKDGIKFINDMDGVPKKVYIDTPENRDIIKKALIQYPEYYFND